MSYWYQYNFFIPGENLLLLKNLKNWWLKNLKISYRICLVVHWLVVVNKTVMQRNGIKLLRHYGYPLERKRRCSNIPGHLHQSPADQLAQELKSIPVDWAVGLRMQSGQIHPCFTTLLDAANSAAAPASRDEASK